MNQRPQSVQRRSSVRWKHTAVPSGRWRSRAGAPASLLAQPVASCRRNEYRCARHETAPASSIALHVSRPCAGSTRLRHLEDGAPAQERQHLCWHSRWHLAAGAKIAVLSTRLHLQALMCSTSVVRALEAHGCATWKVGLQSCRTCRGGLATRVWQNAEDTTLSRLLRNLRPWMKSRRSTSPAKGDCVSQMRVPADGSSPPIAGSGEEPKSGSRAVNTIRN